MARYSKGLQEFARIKKEMQYKKALRLSKNKPKHSDERYMKAEEYEAYIDKYLRLEDGEDPSENQAKIAVAMYDKKKKYEPTEANPLDDDV